MDANFHKLSEKEERLMPRGRPRTAKQYTPRTAPKRLSVPDVDFGGVFKDLTERLPGRSVNKGAARHGDSSRVAPKLIESREKLIALDRDIRQAATEIRIARAAIKAGGE
jgi:hypothetical protein